MAKKKQEQLTSKEPFERILNVAMRSLDWLLPQTEEEVRAQESRIDESVVELPMDLRDPSKALHARKQTIDRLNEPQSVTSEDVQEGLARAARAGAGEITPEIEKQMKQDRENAKSRLNQDES